MSKRSKYSRKEAADFLDYTGDQMSDQERNAFEKELEKDPFAAEALDGLEQVSPADACADLKYIKQRLHKRLTIRRRVMINRVAAAVAALLIAVASLLTVYHDRLGLFPSEVSMTEPAPDEQIPAPEEKAEAAGQIPTEKKAETPAGLSAAPAGGTIHDTGRAGGEGIIDIPAGPGLAEAGAGEKEKKAEAKETGTPVHEESYIMEEPVDGETVYHPEKGLMKESRPEEMTMSRAAEAAVAPVAMQRTTLSAEGPGGLKHGSSYIEGVVISSEDRQPIQGASVYVRGTTTGTVTDAGGRFMIPVTDSNALLVAEFIGMKQKEVPLKDRKDIRIVMNPSAESDEVIMKSFAPPGEDLAGEATAGYAEDAAGEGGYIPAEPSGGTEAFREYIAKNLAFPGNTVLDSAVVVLGFSVDPSGRPSQINVLRSPGEAFSGEAIRLLVQGPFWKPASKDGKYFREETRIRIVFMK